MVKQYAEVSSPDDAHECAVVGESEGGRLVHFSCGASCELWPVALDGRRGFAYAGSLKD